MSKLETLIHLTDSNVGDWVTYCPNEWSDHETGKIKSFDNARQVAWVVYKAEMTVTNREVVALLHDLLTQAKLNEARTKNPMVSELTLARAAYGGSLEKIRTLHKAEILEILAEIEQANWDNYVIGCINKIDEIRNRLNKK
jgi:hypothetical protein